ncbi:MAG: ABC transporter ATP-binding protein [Verrucomicrobiota bacterium JB022]|nr:ABC transporter ATP-binding protein [Verrucomicrobiota bacterium JB022]
MSEPLPASEECRIRLRGVSKRYDIAQATAASHRQPIRRLAHWTRDRLRGQHLKPQFTALREFDLELRPGECIGILGPNGSGKSTLLQIICGILQPSEGTVETSGRIAALLELGSGFDPDFTGRENVYLNASILGLNKKEVRTRFREVEEFADIGGFIDQPVRTYSSGMLMRLAFAVQVLVEPDVLIVDEALSVGDAAFQRKCFSRIEQLRKKGMTILFVSHDISAVLNLCDRAVMLYHGEKLCEGPAKIVTEYYEKLIHSPHSSRPQLIEAIKRDNLRREEEGPKDLVTDVTQDTGLVSKSQQVYPSRGARILRPRLLDRDGNEVNLIKRRGEYTFAYDVEFTEDARNVNFAMLIKTKEGRELGGCRSFPNLQRLEFAPAGTVKTVEFHFTALLNHGVYFTNAGVEGYVEEETTYLHRIVDALAFQVVAERDPHPTCLVDFLFEPKVSDAVIEAEA